MAIWGSCVTRDAFELEGRADELAQRLPLVYYGARSSWVSQASPPLSGEAPDLSALTGGFGRRMVQEDLGSDIVERLVRHRPDVVVLDLVDERLPLARVGRSWITVSDYLRRTDLGRRVTSSGARLVPMADPSRSRHFETAVRRIARHLTVALPRTTFVLHEAPYTTRVGDGTLLAEPGAGWARTLEAAQQSLFRTLAAEFGHRLVRATPPARVCLADPGHRWGVASYHYVPDYYHWLVDSLLDLPPGPGRAGRVGRVGRAGGAWQATRAWRAGRAWQVSREAGAARGGGAMRVDAVIGADGAAGDVPVQP